MSNLDKLYISNLDKYYYTITICTFYPSNSHKYPKHNLYSERGSIFKFTPDERLHNTSRSGFIVDLVDGKETNLSEHGNIPNIYLPVYDITKIICFDDIYKAIENRDNILSQYPEKPETEEKLNFGISSNSYEENNPSENDFIKSVSAQQATNQSDNLNQKRGWNFSIPFIPSMFTRKIDCTKKYDTDFCIKKNSDGTIVSYDKASLCLLNDAFELIKHININNFKSRGLDKTSIENKNFIEKKLKEEKLKSINVNYDVLIDYIKLFFKYLYFFCILNQYYQYYHNNSTTEDYEKRQMLANAVENFLKHYKDLKDKINEEYNFSYDTIPILKKIFEEATSLRNKYFDITKKDTSDYLGHQKTLDYIGYKESTKYENNLITPKPPIENSSDKEEPYIEGSATIIGYNDKPRTRDRPYINNYSDVKDYSDNSGFKGRDGGYRKKSRRLARKTKRVRKGKGTKRRGKRRTSKLG